MTFSSRVKVKKIAFKDAVSQCRGENEQGYFEANIFSTSRIDVRAERREEQWKVIKSTVKAIFQENPREPDKRIHDTVNDYVLSFIQTDTIPLELFELLRDSIQDACRKIVCRLSKTEDDAMEPEGEFIQRLRGKSSLQYWQGLELTANLWKQFMGSIRTMWNLFDMFEGQFMNPKKSQPRLPMIGKDRPCPPCMWIFATSLFSMVLRGDDGSNDRALIEIVFDLQNALKDYRLSDISMAFDGDPPWSAPEVHPDVVTVVEMTKMLDVYDVFCAREMIDSAKDVYVAKGKEAQGRIHYLSRYLAELERRVVLENTLGTVLGEYTADQCMEVLKENLLRKNISTLLDKRPVVGLIEGRDFIALTRLYRLFKDISTQAIRTPWTAYIKEKGTTILNLDDNVVIEELLKFKDQLELIRTRCFESDATFAPREAFEAFLNQDEFRSRSAQLVASHFGTLLEDEVTVEKTTEAMDLFRLIQATDVFEVFYKKDLARRLLTNLSVSAQEMQLVDALRHECGVSFTGKIEGMIGDMTNSNDMRIMFTKAGNYTPLMRSIEFKPVVLTSAYWPSSNSEFQSRGVPREIMEIEEAFKSFYLSKHEKRKVMWHPFWGNCHLRCTFSPGVRKELVVTHMQASLLLLFQNDDELTFADIRNKSTLQETDLIKTIQSLCLQKNLKILLKSHKTKTIQDDEKIIFNHRLQIRTHKVYLNNPPPKDSASNKEELKATVEKVQENREYGIDALVVRVMKTKKTLPLTDLIAEVVAAASFPLNSNDIKKRLTALEDREFIAKRAGSPETYDYLA